MIAHVLLHVIKTPLSVLAVEYKELFFFEISVSGEIFSKAALQHVINSSKYIAGNKFMTEMKSTVSVFDGDFIFEPLVAIFKFSVEIIVSDLFFHIFVIFSFLKGDKNI